MLNIPKTLRGYLKQRRNWEKLMQAGAQLARAAADSGSTSSHLSEVRDFGSNPGALRMLTYLPEQASSELPLVVVLHGCTQTASSYDRGAGWSTLAERFGFALLLPEQQRANNPNGCFNWFEPADTERGRGEALSIRQMIERMVSNRQVDPKRVFVTGLSAGGAMTSVMLATYPEVFAGGAIIAGLPYGAAGNVKEAFENMFQCPSRSARAWGDLVRAASPHKGPWPRVSVWHGGADKTVIPANAREIVKQWTDVHGLSKTPSVETVVDGYPRQVWVNQVGDELIESYTITNMAHGTPLATGGGGDGCGAAGPFLLEAGISSSHHIAEFFGLTNASRAAVASKQRASIGRLSDQASARSATAPSPVLEGEILEPGVDGGPNRRMPRSPTLDIASIINKAFTAAGLMKNH
ncbi:MAG: PHB depolymerase family esterase [Xanthobacteraceae bacterium]